MKKLQKMTKLYIAFGIVTLFLVVGVIMFFTTFSLKKVDVEFFNSTTVFLEDSEYAITGSDSIEYGKSVFLINKDVLTKDLETQNPYLKVINIETIFPNKLKINAVEREECFAIKYNNIYFICDGDFKVLSVLTSFESNQTNAILLNGIAGDLIENGYSLNAGDFIEFSGMNDVMLNLQKSMLLANKSVVKQRAIIKNISIQTGIYHFTAKNQPYLIVEDYNGFKTEIYALETNMTSKFLFMFECLSQSIYDINSFFTDAVLQDLSLIDDNYYLDYKLVIMENLDSKILMRYEKI